MATTTEGTVPFRGYRTWYQVVGGPPATGAEPPLLVVHGGPGLPHDYLDDLARMADGGRAVVFYDQLGCGQSDHPDDPALWVMDTFVEQLATVRQALGLDRIHLLGHSWGGWLALEYALGGPSGLVSLVLASTCASLPAFAAETRRLKQSLPAEVQQVIDRHEAAGTTDDPAYAQAARAYLTRWICRRDPLPDHVLRSFTRLSRDVYATMQGVACHRQPQGLGCHRQAGPAGPARAGHLGSPRRNDPHAGRAAGRPDPGAEWILFQDSAHLAMAEEPDRYRQVLQSWLSRVEALRA